MLINNHIQFQRYVENLSNYLSNFFIFFIRVTYIVIFNQQKTNILTVVLYIIFTFLTYLYIYAHDWVVFKDCLEVLSRYVHLDLERRDKWNRSILDLASPACRQFLQCVGQLLFLTSSVCRTFTEFALSVLQTKTIL